MWTSIYNQSLARVSKPQWVSVIGATGRRWQFPSGPNILSGDILCEWDPLTDQFDMSQRRLSLLPVSFLRSFLLTHWDRSLKATQSPNTTRDEPSWTATF